MGGFTIFQIRIYAFIAYFYDMSKSVKAQIHLLIMILLLLGGTCYAGDKKGDGNGYSKFQSKI